MENLKLTEGMILELKKAHPCGSKNWKVLRAGADMKLECQGCGHVMMMERIKLRKMIKTVHEFSE